MPMPPMVGVTVRLNEISLKVTKLPMPVVRLFSGSTSSRPRTPPSADSSSASTVKLARMLAREKPSTRRVPISAERRATAAYMVFIAAKQLPMAMMTATKVPRYWMGAAEVICWA